jgi:SpoVK/Ycf46/Vps4 family AAA+-type ATPase
MSLSAVHELILSQFIGLSAPIKVLFSHLQAWDSYQSEGPPPACGRILNGPMSSGKTDLLKSLRRLLLSEQCSSLNITPIYLDCSIFQTFPLWYKSFNSVSVSLSLTPSLLSGQAEAYLIQIFHQISPFSAQKYLLLFDNLDLLLSTSSVISLSLTAILLDQIDQILPLYHSRVFLLATSSASSLLPSQFICSYRLGRPIEILHPDLGTRYEIAKKYLQEGGLSLKTWQSVCSDYGLNQPPSSLGGSILADAC